MRPPFDFKQLFYPDRTPRAGTNSVNRFGRENHKPTFRQGLHGPMDDISTIVGLAKVNNNWRHRQQLTAALAFSRNKGMLRV